MADINRFNKWSTKKLIVHYQRISRIVALPYSSVDLEDDMARIEDILREREVEICEL